MDPEVVTSVLLLALLVTAPVLGPDRLCRLFRWAGRATRTCWARLPHREEPLPGGRPIELIAHDAQRLGPRFRNLPARVSFARFEAGRRAYDAVLAEACRALEVEHLLLVIPPGPELDAERCRVERLLARSGLRLDDAA